MAMKDRYGRSISAAEAAKRKKYRDSTKGMSADRRARARQAEMKRRAAYRKGEGAKQFGAAAKKVTRPATAKGAMANKKAAANRVATRAPRAVKAEVGKRAQSRRMAMAEGRARQFQAAQYKAPRTSNGSARTSMAIGKYGAPKNLNMRIQGGKFGIPRVNAPRFKVGNYKSLFKPSLRFK